MMNVIIETDRLILRTFTIEDAELVYELNKDPEITIYTGDPLRDIEHAREVLEKSILPQYALYNHGRWAVLLKPSHEFLGWCGLKYRPELNIIDLGYRFKRSAWGKGYATESANACLDYGFQKLGLERICAHAMPANIASVKVLEKIGMRFIGEGIEDDKTVLAFEAVNPFIT